ncbi:MAG: hypothetical protein KUF77_15415 [Candidatus Thiodiazotropha sp. (ex Lucina aurantia)]|nr:hypothetical protein [Candidatus Thiodiazotropha sp. (ex Lucina pensylvanica)]MBT3017858.1 hypothetical protein [Candidatus Thiodiazotropha taylori]MBT3041003.1 hypothetical protein [Candidatus Thiodiazotropha sp. (ex Codakia orbicularis)]MBV2104413.1 hypothetical protein [Candidatus Thiodiazotropha sp. (ex Lucina aurantia)]MBV2099522.1 hypothetical protein [Candidatus Thiodiazotropha sp. (ex Codakia orbicularis)]
MKLNREDSLRSFSMSVMLLNEELRQVEDRYGIDLGIETKVVTNDEGHYLNQFDIGVRHEARDMAIHYETFYCLEKSIRTLISDILNPDPDGESEWWGEDVVPPDIIERVESRQRKEREEGITPRSSDPIDYTTFGELGGIIKKNWVSFGGVLNDIKAVEKVLARLNTLRGPIAHCSPLAEDEVLRLDLTVRDWLRLLT